MQLEARFFDDWYFEHCALPELDFAAVDTGVEFLGKRLTAPLLISCMTGGTGTAARLNENLALAAERVGVALGVGSQRKALESPALAETFLVRHAAPDGAAARQSRRRAAQLRLRRRALPPRRRDDRRRRAGAPSESTPGGAPARGQRQLRRPAAQDGEGRARARSAGDRQGDRLRHLGAHRRAARRASASAPSTSPAWAGPAGRGSKRRGPATSTWARASPTGASRRRTASRSWPRSRGCRSSRAAACATASTPPSAWRWAPIWWAWRTRSSPPPPSRRRRSKRSCDARSRSCASRCSARARASVSAMRKTVLRRRTVR